MNPVTGVEQVGSLAHMMYEYGPVIVIISVFLMLFIVIMFFMIRQQQVTQEKIMREHQTLIEKLLESQFKNEVRNASKDEYKSSKDIVKEHLRISNAIRVETSAYIALLKASRIAIYSLHNGTNSISGLPFLKFSCISEYVTKSIDSCIKLHTNFPINYMSDLLEDLCEHKDVSFYDEQKLDIPANKVLVDMLLANRSHKYVFRGIFDSSSTLIAFVVCEFDLEQINPSNYKEKSNLIDQLITKLSPILEYSDFNNTYTRAVHINETKDI